MEGMQMTVSRRHFMADASALAMIAALVPELAAGQTPAPGAFTTAPGAFSTEDLPHDSFSFWNGYFDSVNPYSKNYGVKAFWRGPADQLPDPEAQTQYLHYDSDNKHLRYASDIRREELLDHDGDVAVASRSPSSVPELEKAISRRLNCASTLRRFTLS